MLLESERKLDFNDVLIRPKRSTLESRKQMILERKFKTKWAQREFTCVPIVCANMATGTFRMAEVFCEYNMLVAIHKFHTKEDWLNASKNAVSASIFTIGMSDEEYENFKEIRIALVHAKKIDAPDDLFLCVDIANGYTQRFASFIRKIREENPNIVMIAGNVATPEMVQELIIAGADYVKIGIGPGSQCTTRLKAGVGYPQISASVECADAAHGLNGGIILDGGIRSPGDAAKAFIANADIIMIGGMFAGTDEQEGELITRRFLTNELDENNRQIVQEKQYKLFFGMSSEYAQEKFMSGGMKTYRTSEGRKEEILYKGSVREVIDDLLGGLRSAGTYIGAASLKTFGKCGTLIRVGRQHDRF
jgi:GMP reductase